MEEALYIPSSRHKPQLSDHVGYGSRRDVVEFNLGLFVKAAGMRNLTEASLKTALCGLSLEYCSVAVPKS